MKLRLSVILLLSFACGVGANEQPTLQDLRMAIAVQKIRLERAQKMLADLEKKKLEQDRWRSWLAEQQRRKAATELVPRPIPDPVLSIPAASPAKPVVATPSQVARPSAPPPPKPKATPKPQPKPTSPPKKKFSSDTSARISAPTPPP